MSTSVAAPDPNVSADAKFDALIAHYDNTFERTLTIQKRRDRFFLWTVVFVVLLLLRLAAPTEIDSAIAEFARNRLGLQETPNVSMLSSVAWFAILGVVVPYYQAVVLNERYLPYLHKLEDRLSAYYDGVPFTREGKTYLDPSPLFTRWSGFLYTMLFPFLLVCITTAKIIVETRAALSVVTAFNVIIYAAILISTLLYAALLHFKR